MTSSIYRIPLTIVGEPIAAATDILANNIAISGEQVSPGGGGILRIYFSFTFAVTPSTISVFNNSVLKGNLNADNTAQVISDGIYRFDIDVEAGDLINIQSSEIINTVNYVRAHLVQFGA